MSHNSHLICFLCRLNKSVTPQLIWSVMHSRNIYCIPSMWKYCTWWGYTGWILKKRNSSFPYSVGLRLCKQKLLKLEGNDRKTTMGWIIYILNCSQCSSFLPHEWQKLSSPCAYHSTEGVPQENCMPVEQGPVATPLCCLWEGGRKLSAHTSCGFSGRKPTQFGMQTPRKLFMAKLPNNSFKKHMSSWLMAGDLWAQPCDILGRGQGGLLFFSESASAQDEQNRTPELFYTGSMWKGGWVEGSAYLSLKLLRSGQNKRETSME